MSNTASGIPSSFLSLFLTDRVITRNVRSCLNKANTVTSSTRPAFLRYASYTIEYLEGRVEATDNLFWPLLSKYDDALSERADAHKKLSQTIQRARETLKMVETSRSKDLGEQVPKVLGELLEELEPVFDTEGALLNNIGSKVSTEEVEKIEDEEKKRRLRMMKKDGHLWCATYLMRSLTAEEREQFPPGVPNMVKSAMLMAGNWQFSKEFQFAPEML